MIKKLFALLLILCVCDLFSYPYPLQIEALDVVIPCAEKDAFLLPRVIAGIKQNGALIGRVIVVSKESYTDEAEWFDEALFPFTKDAVVGEVFKDKKSPGKVKRGGWLYQQLLKLYAPLVIPQISSNVLILDADTIFLSPTTFLNERGGGLFNVRKTIYKSYFKHAKRLIPGFKKWTKYSGVTHHMVFQRPIIEDLFATIEAYHKVDAWKAFCHAIDKKRKGLLRTASEYEIYFNFALSRSDQVAIRPLIWKEITNMPFALLEETLDEAAQLGLHYITLHQR